MHLIVEAKDRTALSRGMQELTIRIAKALNRTWGCKGKVFKERYHDVVLDNPSRVRNALNYILHNGRKHGIPGLERWFDPCSSARWFDGFRDADPDTKWPASLSHAVTWLLTKGWRRRGLLVLVPVHPAP